MNILDHTRKILLKLNLVPVVYAFNIEDVWPLSTKNTQLKTLGGLISYFYPRALLLAGIIFFFLIVIAGFGMIRGAGGDDPHSKEKAKAFLTYAVIGLVIIFAAYWILQIISYVTGGTLKNLIGG